MLESKVIDKNNYLQEVEISKENFKINGHEIRGITKYKINYDSDSKVVSIDLSINVKSVNNS